MSISFSFPCTSHLVFLLAFFTVLSFSAITPNKLVTRICMRNSDFNFCVNTLYSDLRTPDPDRYNLANAIMIIAGRNADNTIDYLTKLLTRTKSSSSVYQSLYDCKRHYPKAVQFIDEAYGDIISENYEDFSEIAGDSSDAIDQCQAAFRGIQTPQVTEKNKYFKALCEVWKAVGMEFLGGDD